MSRQHHEIQTETEFYQQVEKGVKRFEARKNDRNYKVNDKVILLESVQGVLTGRRHGPLEIDYMLRGPADGIEDGFCVFNWKAQTPINTSEL